MWLGGVRGSRWRYVWGAYVCGEERVAVRGGVVWVGGWAVWWTRGGCSAGWQVEVGG